jgi:hypothetical protein
MAAEPSVRGSVFCFTVDLVKRLIDEGRLSSEQLEARLCPGQRHYFEETIIPTKWYLMAVNTQLTELLYEHVDGGRPDAARARGAEFFDEFLSRSIYQSHLEHAAHHIGRAGEVLVGLTRRLYNFSSWKFGGSLDSEFEIEVLDATPFAEGFVRFAEGFMKRSFERIVGAAIQVVSVRSSPDRIVFKGRVVGPA